MTIKWMQTCCSWHGEYAEHQTNDGGIARFKRSAEFPEVIFVCRFDANNKAVDADGDGVPDYVQMPENDALALLA